MIIRSISLKNVGGSDRPASFNVNEGTTFVTLDPQQAVAVPAALMTLLYPDEVSSSDLARLSGPRADSAWRAEFLVGAQAIRLSRGFAPSSVMLEIFDEDEREWKRDCTGSGDVRNRLTSIVKLPPPTVMEAVNLWINTCPERAGDDDADSGFAISRFEMETSDKVELVATDDYFGNLMQSDADAPVPLGDEERRVLADEFRRARTIEFIEDQIREVEGKLEAAFNELGASVDETGETTRIERELSQIPDLRDLTAEERKVFADPDHDLAELERRAAALDDELVKVDNAQAGPVGPLWKNLAFVIGILATFAITTLSVVGDAEIRRLALANLITLGVALAGFLTHVNELEHGGRTSRRAESTMRRRENLESDRKRFRAVLDALREELPVRDLTEYDRAVGRRDQLRATLDRLAAEHEVAFESSEYRRLAARKERIEQNLKAHRDARQRLGDATVSSFELGTSLTRAGLDQNVILWRPDSVEIELGREVKRLGQVASKYRLISEEGLNPKTIKSWSRVAERILGDKIDGLNLTPEHKMMLGGGTEGLETLDLSHAVAVVEALRMSLHLTLVKAGAPGIQAFSIQVHSDRISDPGVKERLRKMYGGLGERLQVLCVGIEED